MTVRVLIAATALVVAAAACSVAVDQVSIEAAAEADGGVVASEASGSAPQAVEGEAAAQVTQLTPIDEIFFVHEFRRESAIVRMGAERFDQTLLLEYEDDRRSYSVSPDGQTISFLRRDEAGEAGIYLLDADGSNERLLVEHVRDGGRWSRDGSRLLYVRDRGDGAGMRVITFDGESHDDVLVVNSEQLAGQSAERFFGLVNYEWGSDGESVVFKRRTAESTTVRIAQFAGGISTILERPEIRSFALSPDGQTIAFVETEPRMMLDTATLWLAPVNAGEPRQVAADLDGYKSSLRWSPDGRWLAFVQSPNATVNGPNPLFVVSSSGDEVRPLTEDFGGRVVSPTWSPHSDALVFRHHFGEQTDWSGRLAIANLGGEVNRIEQNGSPIGWR